LTPNDLSIGRPLSEIWDRVSSNYTLDINSDESSLAMDIINLFRPLEIDLNSSIIELGCGSGHISGILSIYGYNVSLLDFSEVALSKAKEFFNHYFLKGSFIKGDLMNLNFLGQEFDVTWNSGVMEHFDDKSLYEALLSIRKVTKKYFVFLVPNPDSLPYLLFRHKLMAEGRWEYGEEFLRNDYETFLNKSGFKLIKKEFVGWNYTHSQLNMLLNDNKSVDSLSKLVQNNLISKDNSYLIAYVASPDKNVTIENQWRDDWKGITELRTHIFDQTANELNALKNGGDSTYFKVTALINKTYSTILNMKKDHHNSSFGEVVSHLQAFIDNINYLSELIENLISPEVKLILEKKFSLIDNTIGQIIDEYKAGYFLKCQNLINEKLLHQFDEWQSIISYSIKSDTKII
jgi:SAM-dependent methyltransferase